MADYERLWIAMDCYGRLWIAMDCYGRLWIAMVQFTKSIFFGSVIVSSNKEIKKEASLVVPNVPEIKQVFETIAASKAKLASEGKMNIKTLKRCFDSEARVSHATAKRLVIGLNACGANPPVTKEKLFF